MQTTCQHHKMWVKHQKINQEIQNANIYIFTNIPLQLLKDIIIIIIIILVVVVTYQKKILVVVVVVTVIVITIINEWMNEWISPIHCIWLSEAT